MFGTKQKLFPDLIANKETLSGQLLRLQKVRFHKETTKETALRATSFVHMGDPK